MLYGCEVRHLKLKMRRTSNGCRASLIDQRAPVHPAHGIERGDFILRRPQQTTLENDREAVLSLLERLQQSLDDQLTSRPLRRLYYNAAFIRHW